MSLTQKINEELQILAQRIVRVATKSSDPQLKKLSEAYIQLEKLLSKAEKLEGQNC